MKKWIANGFALTALLAMASCSHGTWGDRSISSSKKRGDTYDYDQGPDKDSDLNYLFANTPNAAGSNITARTLGGVPSWLITNVDFNAAGGGANPTGDGTDARTDGTQRAFTQDQFDEVNQEVWTSGGDAQTCYLSPFQMNVALGFEGNNNQRSSVQAGDQKVINSLAVYVSPWGTLQFMPSRENRSRDVFMLKDDMWSVHVLRPTKNVELAKTGDSTMRQVTTELGLCSKNQQASGAVYDLTTS